MTIQALQYEPDSKAQSNIFLQMTTCSCMKMMPFRTSYNYHVKLRQEYFYFYYWTIVRVHDI